MERGIYMSKIFIQFLSLSVVASIFTIIFFILKPFIKNRLSKTWQYYIWIVIIFRLIFPFSIPNSFINNYFYNETSYYNFNIEDKSNTQTYINIPNNLNKYMDDGVTITEDAHFDLNYLLICVYSLWLIVGCIIFAQKVLSYHSFLKFIKAGSFEILDENILNTYIYVCAENHIKKMPKLCMNKLVKSPMLVGLFNCFIVLPEISLSQQQLKVIFQHELNHYKRFDPLYKWVTQIAVCIHWFNPFVYLIQHEITKSCELSCDEIIIKKLDKQGKQQYGDTLISAMQTNNSYSNYIASITLNEDKILLKERLNSIIEFKNKTKLSTALSFVLTFVLCFGTTITGVQANISDANNKLSSKKSDDTASYTVQNNDKTNTVDTTANTQQDMTILEFGEVPRVGVSVLSENIVVNRGGDTLKIMFDKRYIDNYTIEDYIHSASHLREICIERKDAENPQTEILQTIYITVPESTTWQTSSLKTTSGNISVSDLNARRLSLYSESGSINCIGNNSKYINIKSDTGNISIDLPNTDSLDNYKIVLDTNSNDIKIDSKSYQSGKLELNPQGQKSITLWDTEGNVTIKTDRINFIPTPLLTQSNLKKIELNKIIDDSKFDSLNIDAPVVNIELKNSTDRKYKATLSYSENLAPLYKGANISMEKNNSILYISIVYPNGEINQNSGIEPDNPQNLATLFIEVPPKQYESVKLDIASNVNVNFDIDSYFVDLTSYVGNPYIKFIKKCEDINIMNKVGNLTLTMDSIGKKLKIHNRMGEINYNVKSEPKDFNLKLTNARDINIQDIKERKISELPKNLEYDVDNNVSTYQNGNSLNIIEFYNDLGKDWGGFTMNSIKYE